MYKSKILSILFILCFLLLTNNAHAADTKDSETMPELVAESEEEVATGTAKTDEDDEVEKTSSDEEEENPDEEIKTEDEEPDCD